MRLSHTAAPSLVVVAAVVSFPQLRQWRERESRLRQRGTVDITALELLNNQITTLAEAAWRPVFQAIGDPGDGLVMLDDNPLDCGCSLAWLVTSSSFLSHLAHGAKCANGTAIHDLDLSAYDHNCGR